MKIKLLLTILLLAEIITANAQNAEKEYLKKVLTNLEKIESATYYVTNESWQPDDSTASSTLHGFVKEYDNPMDSTIGASYGSLDANDTTKLEFCYDGNIRVLPYHENKKLAIDDFTFRPLPFRLVSPPFFNHAKNIIRYALTTKDHIATELKDEGDNYYFKLVIDENQQVEFFGKAYHMPLPPFNIGSTASIYESWINKSNDLPYKNGERCRMIFPFQPVRILKSIN